jgi:hypothetical protein
METFVNPIDAQIKGKECRTDGSFSPCLAVNGREGNV